MFRWWVSWFKKVETVRTVSVLTTIDPTVSSIDQHWELDFIRARFPSGAWDKICCSSSDMSMIQAQGFWAWAANLVSSSTWKPGPGPIRRIYDFSIRNGRLFFIRQKLVWIIDRLTDTTNTLSWINSDWGLTNSAFEHSFEKYAICISSTLMFQHNVSETFYQA